MRMVITLSCNLLTLNMPKKANNRSSFVTVDMFDSVSKESTTTTFEALRVGTIFDRGAVFTFDMLSDYARNFQSKAYNGADLQVNLQHNRGSDAAGWIKDVTVEGESLMLTVEWTELGIEKISKKLFKYVSVEVISEMAHWKTGKPITNVLAGVALTNDPALGGQQALELEKQFIYSIQQNMDVFKKFLTLLQSKSTVASEDKATLREMFESLDEEQKEEVKEAVEAVEATAEVKEEEKETTEEEKEDAKEDAKEEEKEVEKEEDLSKKADSENLSKIETLEREVSMLKEEKRMTELSKTMSTMMLSSTNSKGFLKTNETELSEFMRTLTDTQVSQFSKLLSVFKFADMEDVGSNVDHNIDSFESLEAAAKKYAEKNKCSYRQALKEVQKGMDPKKAC